MSRRAANRWGPSQARIKARDPDPPPPAAPVHDPALEDEGDKGRPSE